MQSGVVAPKTSCLGGTDERKICSGTSATCPVCQPRPPLWFGLTVAENATTYTLFADMPGTTSNKYATDNSDALLATKTLARDVVVSSITCTNCSNTNPSDIHITFSGIKGDAR